MYELMGAGVCLLVGGSIGLFTFGLFDGSTQRGLQKLMSLLRGGPGSYRE